MNFQFIYEDTHLVVLSKPAGLLSQGDSSNEASLVDHLRTQFGRHYVGLVHRLDRNTSGLMVVAKRSKAADRLSESLRNGKLERAYVALIEGSITAPAKWTDSLLKDERTNQVMVVSASTKGAKPATLECQPIASKKIENQDATLAVFKLETGRSHQIRAQAGHRSHAVIGDVKYGPIKPKLTAPRPLLHSAFLRFEHPMSHETLSFSDHWPEEFAKLWGQLPEISAINPFK